MNDNEWLGGKFVAHCLVYGELMVDDDWLMMILNHASSNGYQAGWELLVVINL